MRIGIWGKGTSTWKNKVLFTEFEISDVAQFQVMTEVQDVAFEMCGRSPVGEILPGVKEFRTQPRH